MADVSGAKNDLALVEQWLGTHESEETRASYRNDVEDFLTFLRSHRKGKKERLLPTVTFEDLSAWKDGLTGALSSQARRISAVRSLLLFAARLGYSTSNLGSLLRAPKVPSLLAHRILPEADVARIIEHATGSDATLLRFLYASGCRASEVTNLRWENLTPTGAGTVATIVGKGTKERAVFLPRTISDELGRMRADAPPEAWVFHRASGAKLTRQDLYRKIRRAAKKAGLEAHVSPHWFRHSHASHALDHGASIAELRQALGHGSLATTGKYLHALPGGGPAEHLPMFYEGKKP